MPPDSRLPLLSGTLLAATGVVFGAFGVHGLRSILSPEALGWWQTAVQWQMWQAIGLVALGAARIPGARLPAAALLAGTTLFCGTLYAMALTDLRWLGAVTPIGGALMIGGWAWLAWRLATAPAGP